MFKVGDRVKLNKAGELQNFELISPNTIYTVVKYEYPNVALGGVEVSYWKDYFKLAESAPETEKEEVKMLKVEVKETTKAGEKKFPCIRKGKTTGNLYLFHQPTYGYGLDTEVSSSWSSSEPFTGTVTLTQE